MSLARLKITRKKNLLSQKKILMSQKKIPMSQKGGCEYFLIRRIIIEYIF